MRGKSAFSLVELMVVVSILGILVALVVPRFGPFMAQARRGEAKANLAHISMLQAIYRAEHWKYYGQSPQDRAMIGGAGIGNGGNCNDYNDNTEAGLNNGLGFAPKDCRNLRYHYSLLVADPDNVKVLAYGASNTDGKYIYPNCSGAAGTTQCRYGQGDVVTMSLNSGKPVVCRNIIKYCPDEASTAAQPDPAEVIPSGGNNGGNNNENGNNGGGGGNNGNNGNNGGGGNTDNENGNNGGGGGNNGNNENNENGNNENNENGNEDDADGENNGGENNDNGNEDDADGENNGGENTTPCSCSCDNWPRTPVSRTDSSKYECYSQTSIITTTDNRTCSLAPSNCVGGATLDSCETTRTGSHNVRVTGTKPIDAAAPTDANPCNCGIARPDPRTACAPLPENTCSEYETEREGCTPPDYYWDGANCTCERLCTVGTADGNPRTIAQARRDCSGQAGNDISGCPRAKNSYLFMPDATCACIAPRCVYIECVVNAISRQMARRSALEGDIAECFLGDSEAGFVGHTEGFRSTVTTVTNQDNLETKQKAIGALLRASNYRADCRTNNPNYVRSKLKALKETYLQGEDCNTAGKTTDEKIAFESPGPND